jgi:hypothetical protein
MFFPYGLVTRFVLFCFSAGGQAAWEIGLKRRIVQERVSPGLHQ